MAENHILDLRELHKCTEVSDIEKALDRAGVPNDYESRLITIQKLLGETQQFSCTFDPEPFSIEEKYHIAAHRLASMNKHRDVSAN